LASPLFELTKKDMSFVWNQDCQRAFDALKRALVEAPILVRPDALSRNPVGQATDDDNFSEEVQDVETIPNDPTKATESMFSVQYGQDSEWFGFRRHAKKLTEHCWCCFGINHWRCSANH
jgi:hypothetical protein